MRDAQNDPNERPIRAQREASFDLADKLTQLKRRQAAQSATATKCPERSPQLVTSSPGAGPSTATPRQQPSASTISPQPSGRRARSPSPMEAYDRGPSRSHLTGRLFDPTAEPSSSRQPMIIPNRSAPQAHIPQQQLEAMSDASSVGGGGSSPRKPLPARVAHAMRARGPAAQAGSAALSMQRNPQTAQRHTSPDPTSTKRLFDPSRDDPLRFSAMSSSNRQSATPSIATTNTGYISTSSTSDSRSLASSAFTLSSATSGTSVDSGPYQGKKSEPANVTPLVAELKRVYREISEMEKKLAAQHVAAEAIDEEPSRFDATPTPVISPSQEDKWLRLVEGHKALVELDYRLLEIATGPSIPASVQSIPDRYNIPMRLWSIGFHRMIVTLRRACANSPNALEILTDFIYYAYKFYTELLEEHNLRDFRGKWLEALGDLASYRMAVAIHEQSRAAAAAAAAAGGDPLTASKLACATARQPAAPPDTSRVDESPAPSVGARAAAEMGENDERETWRATARDWYAMGLKDTPGAGRLQHHLGTLTRDIKGEELRTVYHFTKSLIAIHPFDAGREAMLTFFSPQTQQALAAPTASATSIFLHIQSQLFTRIDLDQVQPNLARFIERLELDEPSGEEGEWVMMAVLAIGSILEFGKPDGVIRRACGMEAPASSAPSVAGAPSISRPTSWGTDGGASVVAAASARAQPWVAAQAAVNGNGSANIAIEDHVTSEGMDNRMDEDHDDPSHLSRPMQALTTGTGDSPRSKQAQLVFSLAMEVAFTTLGYLVKTKPYMSSQSFVKPPLNPYITVMLTFIATIFKYPAVLPLMERSLPWGALADLLGTAFRRSGGPHNSQSTKEAAFFGLNQILPEDWSLRGMEWTSRRVYERGFWLKAHKGPLGALVHGEMDVIIPSNAIMSPTFAAGGAAAARSAGISAGPGGAGAGSANPDGFDGIVEDDAGDDDMEVDRGLSPAQTLGVVRWRRLRSAAEMLVRCVPGFQWDLNSLSIGIVGDLADKIALWEQERLNAEEERAMAQARLAQQQQVIRHRRVGSQDMDVDEADYYETQAAEDYGAEDVEDDEDDDPDDSEQVRELKARRRYLRSLTRMSQRASPPRHLQPTSAPARRTPKTAAPSRPLLKVLPGYTVLVVDTNILLSSLSVVATLVDSNRWTIVVPLAVVTELDGISKNVSPLGNAAMDALNYLISAVPAHSTLKVQTSKGNYLRTLSVRSENVDFSHGSNHDRNMDDLILRSAAWQAEHFFDYRSLTPSPDGAGPAQQPEMGTSKVVVLSFDRNLRLKARSRKLDAADEKDMGSIMAATAS